MAAPSWHVRGRYYETCNCDFVCPCVPWQLAVKPTKGSCIFAMAFQIEEGRYGAVGLDGLGFILVGSTPAEMGKGNWSVGVIVDERASADQRDAITVEGLDNPQLAQVAIDRVDGYRVAVSNYVVLLGELDRTLDSLISAFESERSSVTLATLAEQSAALTAQADALRRTFAVLRSGAAMPAP